MDLYLYLSRMAPCLVNRPEGVTVDGTPEGMNQVGPTESVTDRMVKPRNNCPVITCNHAVWITDKHDQTSAPNTPAIWGWGLELTARRMKQRHSCQEYGCSLILTDDNYDK